MSYRIENFKDEEIIQIDLVTFNDEPFSFVGSGDLVNKGGEAVKAEIKSRFGLDWTSQIAKIRVQSFDGNKASYVRKHPGTSLFIEDW